MSILRLGTPAPSEPVAAAKPTLEETVEVPSPDIEILPEPLPVDAEPTSDLVPLEPAPVESRLPHRRNQADRGACYSAEEKSYSDQGSRNRKIDKVHAKQEVLQFEPVTRGRFEKSEPTIVEGQDLDVPTFLRKNIRVK